MADHLFEELDRWEVDLLDDLSDEGIRDSFRNWQQQAVSPEQMSALRDYRDRFVAEAAAQELTLTSSRIRRGRTTIETTVLRDARGRFVATGVANVRRRLLD